MDIVNRGKTPNSQAEGESMEIKTGGNAEKGKIIQNPKKTPANKNLQLREGHNKVSDKLKKKKRFFSYKT